MHLKVKKLLELKNNLHLSNKKDFYEIYNLNVTCVVNLKLVFSSNLVVLIKLCKIRYLNQGRSLLFPRIQVFCLKN